MFKCMLKAWIYIYKISLKLILFTLLLDREICTFVF